MTVKSQKTRLKFFQVFKSSNLHSTVVKSPFLETMCTPMEHGFRSGGLFLYFVCYHLFYHKRNTNLAISNPSWMLVYEVSCKESGIQDNNNKSNVNSNKSL